MWKNKPSIQSRFLNQMTYIVFISLGLWCLIWVHGEYAAFKSESNLLRSSYIKSQKHLLKTEVTSVIDNINTLISLAKKDAETIEELKEKILNRVVNLRFGEEGYFFGSTFQGEPLFSNGKITRSSANIWELTDPKGVKIIQEQRKAASNSQGGFVYYSWKKLNSKEPLPKVNFVLAIPAWEWIIGAGVYLDTVEQKIAENRTTLIAELKKRVTLSIVVLAGLLLLIYFWSNRISNQIKTSISTFSSFLEKARTDSVFIDTNKIELQEFKDIAISINKMLEERRGANEKLRKNEEKFRLAFHISPDSVNLNTLEDGEFMEINEGFTNIMGYSLADVIGKTSREIKIWDNPKDLARLVAALKENGIVENFEAAFRRKDGKIKIGLLSARLVNIDNKKMVLAMTRDITDRKQMEMVNGRFLTAIEQLAEAIVITDIDGRIEYVNPAFENSTGYSIQEALDKNPKILKSGEHDESFYHHMWETITSGSTWKGRLINKKKNGSQYTEEATISPVFDKTGKIINFVAVKRDITHEIQMEKQLQQAQRMEAIGTLAGGIAHDFNNILFPIIGYTEMLLQDTQEEGAMRSGLNEIYTSAIRAKDLVQQILAFSRQEKGDLKLMKMQPIIKEALKMLRSTIPATIEMTQKLDRESGFIKADPTQIHQIVMNLATNAYHAMEETGGKLKIGLKDIQLDEPNPINPELSPGLYTCLSVEDTGKGMNKQTMEKIFDPFFTTKETGKGTGMGLSVVHGIVQKNQGAIKVMSQTGKGTQVYVYLPVVKAASKRPSFKAEGTIQGGSEQILLIDDEQGIITMEKIVLERLGYQVTSRTSSIEALEAFKSSPKKFDLVITDMNMPKMPGDKLAVELIKVRPDIPILLCTGFSQTLTKERIKSLGIKGLLLKPIIMKDLAKKIRKTLDEQS